MSSLEQNNVEERKSNSIFSTTFFLHHPKWHSVRRKVAPSEVLLSLCRLVWVRKQKNLLTQIEIISQSFSSRKIDFMKRAYKRISKIARRQRKATESNTLCVGTRNIVPLTVSINLCTFCTFYYFVPLRIFRARALWRKLERGKQLVRSWWWK